MTEHNISCVLSEWQQQQSQQLPNQFNEDLVFVTSTLGATTKQVISLNGVYVGDDAERNIRRRLRMLPYGRVSVSDQESYCSLYTRLVNARSFNNFGLAHAVFTRKDIDSC